ncbi:MAG: hypothetical protein WA771_02885 [Chthoniobacterales bacterium]
MIQANCRARFTAEDFDFIVRSLSHSSRDAVSLTRLLLDADSRDEVLDHDALSSAILESPDSLRISSHLYFYVLSRRVLKNTSVSSRDAADYIAALLEAYSHTGQASAATPSPYLSDILIALREASPAEAFRLRAHLANSALFLAGIFSGHLDQRASRGAPDLSFYEDLGSASFRAAATHRDARRLDLDRIFEEIGAGFRDARLALNDLADRLFHFESPTIPAA